MSVLELWNMVNCAFYAHDSDMSGRIDSMAERVAVARDLVQRLNLNATAWTSQVSPPPKHATNLGASALPPLWHHDLTKALTPTPIPPPPW
jgi:hypothetical protein